MLKNWWNTFVTALTKPRSYSDLMKRSFWRGYGYLYLFFFIITLAKSVQFGGELFRSLPKVEASLPVVKQTIVQAYPEELVIEIKNGQASTNVVEPYTITLKDIYPKLKPKDNARLVTIDTRATADDYERYGSFILLTKNHLIYPARNESSRKFGAYEITPLSSIKEDLVIDRPLYSMLTAKILPYVDKVPAFLQTLAVVAIVLFPFIGALFMVNAALFYLLVMTLVVWIIAKLMKRGLSYGTLFKTGLYGLTLPVLVLEVASLARLQIPGLYNLTFIGWMICVLTLNRPGIYTQSNARSKKVSPRKALSPRRSRA